MKCSIEVLWERDPDITEITLEASHHEKSMSTDHLLQVDVSYDKKESLLKWEKFLVYECSTDKCNSLNQLKKILKSLTINDTLNELTHLLEPIKPFQGQWCYRDSNATFQECNTTIPISSCKQCTLNGMINQTKLESCATCSTYTLSETSLSHGVIFNMRNRTNIHFWSMICERESCNIPAVGDSIHSKSYMDFDYDKFFSTDNKSTSILSMNKITLIFIGIFIKSFY